MGNFASSIPLFSFGLSFLSFGLSAVSIGITVNDKPVPTVNTKLPPLIGSTPTVAGTITVNTITVALSSASTNNGGVITGTIDQVTSGTQTFTITVTFATPVASGFPTTVVMTPMNQNIVIHWLPWLSSFSSTGFTITGRTTTSVAQITGNLFSYYCI